VPRFEIYFQVEQLMNGVIEVDADSFEAATTAFYQGDYDEACSSARLDTVDREGSIITIRAAGTHGPPERPPFGYFLVPRP
jgi:hypothetical protein